jgi:NADPH:quinone reductase-like Zn-dependent oxidoreductase
MNAAVVQAFDAPPRYATFEAPTPRDGEVLVNVSAAGLHRIVRSLASGTHYGSTGELPFIPGVDGVGRLEDGSRVFFAASRSPYGSFAEQSIANPAFCLPLPDALDDATAAGLANPAMSSWAALTMRAKLQAGENVLILGATGVSGKLAVQIAKRLGAKRVIAVGRNPQALEESRQLGADAIISLNQERDALISALRSEWAVAGVDVVLDYLWGEPAERLLEAISQKGLQHAAARIRYLQIGSTAGNTINLPAATLRSSGLELLGSGFGSVSIPDLLKSVGEFFNEAAQKPLQVDIQTVPLRDIEAMWNKPEQEARLVFQMR